MPQTKHELWCMAHCATITHSASAEDAEATMITDRALGVFGSRGPEIRAGMQD